MTTIQLILMHLGFVLWFIAGYSTGKLKERKRWIKQFGKAINMHLPKVKNIEKKDGAVTFTIGK